MKTSFVSYLEEKVKKKVLFLLFFSLLSLANSVELPYSNREVISESNKLSGFQQVIPQTGYEDNLNTQAWLWYDRENLYLRLEQVVDEKFVMGPKHADDYLGENDCDEINFKIIPAVDSYYAYLYSFKPQGYKYDLIMNLKGSNDNWKSHYDYTSSFHKDASGKIDKWIVEAKMPFQDLRFSNDDIKKWKVVFFNYRHSEHVAYAFPYYDRQNKKSSYRNAYDIELIEPIERCKNYDITTYYVKNYDLITKEASYDPDNIGIDISYNPMNNSNIKLSLNPDFSDVPLDDETDVYNSKYAPVMDENRRFFNEEMDVLGFDSYYFYTRNIVQPEYALKMTGEIEHLEYAFLSAKDKIVKGNSNDLFNILALKPKYDRLTLNTSLLSRQNDSYHNEIVMFSPSFEYIKNHYINVKYNLSNKSINNEFNQYQSTKGYEYGVNLSGYKNYLSYCLDYDELNKDFISDLGIVNRSNNTRKISSILSYYIPNPFPSYITSILLTNSNTYSAFIEEYYGRKLDFANINLDCTFGLKGNSSFMFTYKKERENAPEYTQMNKLFDSYKFSLIYDNFNIKEFSYSCGISYGEELLLNFLTVNEYTQYDLYIKGCLNQYISYKAKLTHKRIKAMLENAFADDNYSFGNIGLDFYLSKKLSIASGVNFNNYETIDNFKFSEEGYIIYYEDKDFHVGGYLNLTYAVNEDLNLYLGYKNIQDRFDEKYSEKVKNAYLKVSYAF